MAKVFSQRRRVRRSVVASVVSVLVLVGLSACDPPAQATLTGVITDSSTSGPAAGVSVELFANDAETVVGQWFTDGSGRYTVRDEVADGSYRVRVNREHWVGGSSWATATPYALAAGTTVTLDQTLALQTGTISGTLIPRYNTPVQFLRASDRKVVASVAPNAPTNDTFTSPALPPGDYYVKARGFYAPSAPNHLTAEVVTVAPGQAVTGVELTYPAETATLRVVSPSEAAPMVWGNYFVFDGETRDVVASSYGSEDTADLAVGHPYHVLIVPYGGGHETRPYFLGETEADPFGTPVTLPAGLTDLGLQKAYGADCFPWETYPGVDLSGQDLSGKQLHECDLSGANLDGANLDGADITKADLTGASLVGASVRTDKGAAIFEAADLTDADLTGLQPFEFDYFTGSFDGAVLSGADLTGADLSYLSLIDADLTGSVLNDTLWWEADLSDADLTGASSNGVFDQVNGLAATFTNTTCPDGYVVPPAAPGEEYLATCRDHELP